MTEPIVATVIATPKPVRPRLWLCVPAAGPQGFRIGSHLIESREVAQNCCDFPGGEVLVMIPGSEEALTEERVQEIIDRIVGGANPASDTLRSVLNHFARRVGVLPKESKT